MPVPERPRLRRYLALSEEDVSGRTFVLWDRLRIGEAQVLGRRELEWLQRCDGAHTVSEILEATSGKSRPSSTSLESLTQFLERLDAGYYLDTPTFHAQVSDPVRPPTCLGTYAEEPEALRHQLEAYFTGPDGPGLPRAIRPDNSLRAALLPHIDYGRGGTTYAWGFKEVVERTSASLFLIIGTSHQGPQQRFTLTRKAFATPLGVTPTDGDFLDRFEKAFGPGLYDDEWLGHLPEWSIELEVVFLQYLYEKRRPIRIVPLVVGSFHDAVMRGHSPQECADVSHLVEALRRTIAETREPVCTIISGDLAHIGPYFEKGEALPDSFLAHSKSQDRRLLQEAETANAEHFFRVIAEEDDSRRICGLPPTYTALAALEPGNGKILHYDQYVHPRREQSVSFASVGFYA